MADQRPRGRGLGRGTRRPEQSGGSGAPGQPPQRGPPQHQQQPQVGQSMPPSSSGRAIGRGQRPGGAGAGAPPQQEAPARRPGVPASAGRAISGTSGITREMGALKVDTGAAGDIGDRKTVPARGRRNPLITEMIRTRPMELTTKRGTEGQAIRLQSNYFELMKHTDWCLYTYRVDFAPDDERTAMRKKMIRVHQKTFQGYIFDGTMLFTSVRLHPDPMELFSDHPIENTPVRITVRLVGDLAAGDAHYIQFFNLIVKRCLGHLKLQLINRDYFDAMAKIDIREFKMEIWPGYKTSIRQHENNLLMCCEIAHKVMRKDTVLDLLKECVEGPNVNQKLFEQRIIGSIVLTDYNNRTYKVDDVDWAVTPDSCFEMRDHSKVSYRDYYQKKYCKAIRDRSQPLLISRAKQREIRAGMAEMIYLVPELCRCTGLTDAQRNNFALTRAMSEYTRVAPQNRIEKLHRFCERLRQQPEAMADLKEWGLKLADRIIDIPARILPTETIVQGPRFDVRFSAGNDAEWSRTLRANPMLVSVTMEKWACICPSNFRDKAKDFVGMLIKAARGMNMNMQMPILQRIDDDRVPTYLTALETVINTHRPQCIFCIVSNNKADRYSAIKKRCCVDRPVPTQVFVAKTLNNKNPMSVATKVAIQINCKMGGAAWGVPIPKSGIMIVGFDVCHDSMNKSKDYGAMVASLDQNCTRYFSSVSPHSKGEELSNDFAMNILKAIAKYKEINKAVPQVILIYRDGVGDGQIHQVLTHEVEVIKEKLEPHYPNNSLRMAFIIVSKRINTRLFFRGQNPPPGTVVDDVITLPERYDFFIVSQHVHNGSVSPTSYNVIHDTSRMGPNEIQSLTYKLCHLYFNWSGTVRVPAPCQYAHKLAFLVAQAIHRNFHPQLETCLFFL